MYACKNEVGPNKIVLHYIQYNQYSKFDDFEVRIQGQWTTTWMKTKHSWIIYSITLPTKHFQAFEGVEPTNWSNHTYLDFPPPPTPSPVLNCLIVIVNWTIINSVSIGHGK